MIVAFELSMPSNGSWDGRWSGAEKRYVRVQNVGISKKARSKWGALIGRYSYSFGDGWTACVVVSEVDPAKARALRKVSAGFCGYDWMIDSIRFDGDIYGPQRSKPTIAALSPEDRHD
jgi:hypothetical protein